MAGLTLWLRAWILRWPYYRRIDRVTRYKAFDAFRLNAEARFGAARQDVWEMQYFEETYDFHVVGAGPGQGDARSVDIFFGKGIYGATPQWPEARKEHPDPAKMYSDAESGAALSYRRLENGAVLLLLYPAKTERSSPLEQTILLGEVHEPAVLEDPEILRTHLRWLVAYMAHTSLDGALLPCQWLRIVRLRLFHRWQEDGKWKRPRILTWGMWLVAWFFSVGLSGGALAVVQASLKPKQDPVVAALNAQKTAEHQDATALADKVATLTQATQGSLHVMDQLAARTNSTPPDTAKDPQAKNGQPVPDHNHSPHF